MNRIKAIRLGLWCLNLLLVVLVVVFAFNNLLFPAVSISSEDDSIKPLGPPPSEPGVDRTSSSYTVIWVVPNPMEKKPVVIEGGMEQNVRPLSSFATLVAVDLNSAHPQKSSAVLKLQDGSYATAYAGRPVVGSDGQPVALLTGYLLVEVYLDRVVFEREGRHREELRIDSAGGGKAMESNPSSTTLSSGKPLATPAQQPQTNTQDFSSAMVLDTPERKAWAIDAREREWVSQNQDQMLGDVSLSPYASGGVRLDRIREGSFILSRGYQEGDVIKSINGREVKSLSEAQTIVKDPAIRNSNTLIVVVNRAGRLVTLEYALKGR